MMQAQMNREVTKNIFGAYIFNTRVIPGRECSGKTKEKEERLFEIVEDYIEQA